MTRDVPQFYPPRYRKHDTLLLLLLIVMPWLIPGLWIWDYPYVPGADGQGFFLYHTQYLYDNLARGIIPLWNPYLFAGLPTYASGLTAPFYPPYLFPLLIFGPVTAFKIKALLHLSLGAAGCYLLLRAWFVRPWLAWLGAVTFLLSGHTMTKAFLIPIGDAAAWVPLMFWLNLRFSRRPNLNRGLWLGACAGCMLLLFVPQVVLTLCLILALAAAARHIKCHARQPKFRPQGGANWPHRLNRYILPVAEVLVLILLLRYPKDGWQNAVSGLGKPGLILLAFYVLAWLTWLIARGLRLHIDIKRLKKWAPRYVAVWILAGSLAAPQLAITAEAIPQTNQQQLDYTKDDFFTGAMSWGCIQHFVEVSAMGQKKETVNNMALGPAIFLLILAGAAGGFWRQRRPVLFCALGIAIVGAVYFAAPGLFDIFHQLPFFKKFKGLSRYLSFLNPFLILFAILAAQMWLRRLKGRSRQLATLAIILLLLANFVPLLSHANHYMHFLTDYKPPDLTSAPRKLLQHRLRPEERFLLDLRNEQEEKIAYLMMSLAMNIEGLPNYDPMRLAGYDRWLKAHNDSQGVTLGDYRMPLWQPVPTDWTRAMRVGLYLFPPGENPPAEVLKSLHFEEQYQGWRVYRDPWVAPVLWPESDPQRPQPKPQSPEGWQVEVLHSDLHHRQYRVFHPGNEATWAILPIPYFSGWTAWIDDLPAQIIPAHGFMQAIRIQPGTNNLRVEYRARGFAVGWLAFLLGIWTLVALATYSTLSDLKKKNQRSPNSPTIPVMFCLAGLPVILLIAGRVLTSVPDQLNDRLFELLLICFTSLLGSLVIGFYQNKNQNKISDD